MAKYNKYIVAYMALLVFAIPGAYWWTGGLDKVIASETRGLTKATALVSAYAKHVGAHEAIHQTLDEKGDRSFGDFGFLYIPARNVLQARVYIVLARRKNYPDVAAGEEQSDRALNDPKIGGMYDRGGGYFFFDEKKQITFLVKDYDLNTIAPAAFIQDVDNLNSLGGIWVMSWLSHAANQTFGREPMPTQFATREHNPYPR